MATCKDCLHIGVCAYCVNDLPICDSFKDRSRFVELPCKVGDTVYVITYCRCGHPECYDKQHCHKQETKRTPKVIASRMVRQMGRKYNYRDFSSHGWEWKPVGTICYRVYQKPFNLKMLSEYGKTVFLTREEAEQALAERSKQ